MKQIRIATLLAVGLAALGCAQSAPQLSGSISKWVNSTPIDLQARKGKVTVVEFWTFGCINCKHNLPIYGRWHKLFRDKGVTIIGVHTPETSEERVDANVRAAIKRQGIEYPVVIDTDASNWNRWGLQAWPTVFLIDKKGQIRAKFEGELNWNGKNGEAEYTQMIQKLLEEKV